MLSAEFSKSLGILSKYLQTVTINVKILSFLYYMDMQIPKVRQIITPKSRIVLKKAEKTLRGRTKKAQELSNVLQKTLLNYSSGNFSFEALKKIIINLDELNNISLNIGPLTKKNCEACLISDLDVVESSNKNYNVDFVFNGYTMMFKTEDDIISNTNGEIVHEMRHLIDSLCFPKTLLYSNPEQWFDKDKTNKFNEIHSFIMEPNEYKPKKILGFIKIHTFEKELKEKIKDFDNITAIKFLQKRRYQIQSEINAYNDYMLYYCRKIPQNPSLLIGIPKYYLGNKNRFEFPEKMRVLKKIIKELIQQERSKFKSA